MKAISISRTVLDTLRRDGLTGRVLANYPRACNLVTAEGKIVALVSPSIGNGPLNIVIEGIEVLEKVKPGVAAVFSDGQLVLGDSLVVLLDGAQLWCPEVNWDYLTKQRRRLEHNLAKLCHWLTLNGIDQGLLGLILDEGKEPEAQEGLTCSPHNVAFLATAQAGIKGLLQALQDGDRSGIRESAALLAGLGPGLTPAGDDYLVGLMAGLRAWPGLLENSELSPDEVCRIVFEATEGRTTLLSNAFLNSAREGLFGENWHELLAGLAREEVTGIRRAVKRILSSGATSGADALAGFLSLYLCT